MHWRGWDCIWALELLHFSVFEFYSNLLGLFKTQIVELQSSLFCGHKTHHGPLPYPQTVSWHLEASLCLRKNNLGLSVCEKGCKSKAFVKTIWWFYWSMWAEHMEALRKKKSALFSSLGLMRRCVTNSYSSRHVVWDTLAHFTDEFVKSSRGHHLLPVYSINWVVWETLQVCLWEEGN